MKVEQAFHILYNNVSRIIYDHYGHTGIEVYETYKDQFKEYEEELNKDILGEKERSEMENLVILRAF